MLPLLVALVIEVALQGSGSPALGSLPPEDETTIAVFITSVEDTDKVIKECITNKFICVMKYFDIASYGRAKVRFEVKGCVSRVRRRDDLGIASAAEAKRRSFVKNVLLGIDRASLEGTGRVMIVTDHLIWPFTVMAPLSDLPRLRTAAVISLDTDWGTIAHEVGHLLGLPDLYDHRLADKEEEAAKQFGSWCLMSRSRVRPGLSAWCRLSLGWLVEGEIARVKRGEEKTVQLDPTCCPTTNFLVAKVELAASRYYLVEARRRAGLDACLPQDGVIITRVDYFADHYSDRITLVQRPAPDGDP